MIRVGYFEQTRQEIFDLRGFLGLYLGAVSFLRQLGSVVAHQGRDQQEHGRQGQHAGAIPLDEFAASVEQRVALGAYRQPGQVASDIFFELLHRGVASLRFFAQGHQHNFVEIALDLPA